MSRERLAFLVVLLAVAPLPLLSAGDAPAPPPADTPAPAPSDGASVTSIDGFDPAPAPAPGRLTFTYPCTFTEADGKPYATRVTDWVCDYIHATVKGGADFFNKTLPNRAAQDSFLGVVTASANTAHNAYINKVGDLIKKTDPASLPKTLSDADRITKIGALNVELSQGVFEAAQPFLWPPREQESYVTKTAGPWPSSWDLYMQPLYDRTGELSGMVQASEMKLIDQASVDFENKVRAAETSKTAGLKKTVEGAKTPNAGGMIGRLFDGAVVGIAGGITGGPGGFASGFVGGFAAGAGTPPPKSPAKAGPGANVVNSVPIPVSDLKSLPPPIPTTEAARAQRNYFARGAAAGLERLKDDQTVGLWHAFGQTTTIGDPNGKAALVFTQKGNTCAFSALDEALNARLDAKDRVPIEKIAQEGYQKGYYVDYETTSGAIDGGETDWKNVNLLFDDHHVKYDYVLNATPEMLDQAIRNSPQHDAIVDVKIKSLWSDGMAPDGAQHALYVTGEEVGKDGKVRGYYVNDTGTGEAARFIAVDDFNKAWMNVMVAFPKETSPKEAASSK